MTLAAARADHAAALLLDGRVFIGGGAASAPGMEVVEPASGSATPVAGPANFRKPTATLLPSGLVYFTGDDSTTISELFDPTTNALTPAVGKIGAGPTATLLPSGHVLVVGGSEGNFGTGTTLASAALFDPIGNAFFPIAPMSAPRQGQAATLLPSGLVLVTGGWDYAVYGGTATVELYDPASSPNEATIEATGTMLVQREHHTATVLPKTGTVLVTGGDWTPGVLAAEIFEPATGVFREIEPPLTTRVRHTATFLPSLGQVLIAGGIAGEGGGLVNSTELFDPVMERFLPATPLMVGRSSHVAALLPGDDVLLAGGTNGPSELRSIGGASSALPALPWGGRSVGGAFAGSGSLLLCGGRGTTDPSPPTAAAVLLDPSGLSSLPPMTMARSEHTATALPDGSVLIAGGATSMQEGVMPTATAERWDGTAFTPTGSMSSPRSLHTATMLSDQKSVLFTGGYGSSGSIELYDVASRTFAPLPGTVPQELSSSTAVLLADGRVLITGGNQMLGASGAAVVYGTQAGLVLPAPQAEARAYHTATVLVSGQVLLAGGASEDITLGNGSFEARQTASLFDPVARTYQKAPIMTEQRMDHTATLLPDGRVLLAGGRSHTADIFASATAEVFAKGTFVPFGNLRGPRAHHTATLLASGSVLLVGGRADTVLASAEILDPMTGASRATGSLHDARSLHAAVRLPSGRVLIAGGVGGADEMTPVTAAEIFDPRSGTFSEVTSGTTQGLGETHGSLLPDGTVLLAGGNLLYRFDEASGELSRVGAGPAFAFGVAVLPGGRGLVCGQSFCDRGVVSGLGPATVINSVQNGGHSLTPLPDGEIFALGVTPFVFGAPPIGGQHTFSFRAVPPRVVLPVVMQATAKLVPGQPATATGMRFAQPSAKGSASQAPLAGTLPLVVFVPDASLVPVQAPVESWSDTSIAFTAPHTPFLGGGFLHVLVDAVPSAGYRVTLEAVSQGGACVFDGECATGHCAEGVCCDAACDGGCLTCSASGAVGKCGPIAEGTAARSGCAPTGGACSPTGVCDGFGDCAYPPEGTHCEDPPGGTCVKGVCTGPCTSNLDCVAGYVCVPDGRCVAPTTAGPDAPLCACRAGGGGALGAPLAVVALCLAGRRGRGGRRGRRGRGGEDGVGMGERSKLHLR
jgi:hypothetical protein